MKRLLLKGGLLCLLCFAACIAWADETDDNLTATWDWENDNPSGIRASTDFQGTSSGKGTLDSSIEGIVMTVDATSGKLSAGTNSYAQFNSGTILQVPVAEGSVVTVKRYPGDYTCTIGGTDATFSDNVATYTATSTDAETGYVAIVATNNGYLNSVSVTYLSQDDIDKIIGVTATWDWENDNPEGLQTTTIKEGSTDYITSTYSTDDATVKMYVDATSGQLAGRSSSNNDVQLNEGTILRVPVVSTSDVVTIVSHSNYYYYTVGGTAATDVTTTYKAQETDAEQGYVEIKVTSTSYVYSITVKYESEEEIAKIDYNKLSASEDNTEGDDQNGNTEGGGTEESGKQVEKALYTTDFTEWPTISSSSEGVTNTVTTKYSDEELTFTLVNASVDPEGTNDKFSSLVGYIMTDKKSGVSITTSELKSITKITFTQAGTGTSGRGIKISVQGTPTDENETADDDWVTVFDTQLATQAGEEHTIEINRTDCQIKFESLDDSANAYVTDLAIYGNITLTEPTLATFTLNNTEYDAYEVFTKSVDNDKMEGTVYISSSENMPSETNAVTATADYGEVGSISYTTDTDNATVNIEVKEEDGTASVTYVLSVERKPMHTLTYYNLDGTTVLGTQQVEEDATIGTFNDYSSSITPGDGYTFRGWFVSTEGGKKYTTDYVVTEDISLYAVATETEVQSTTARYEYDLTYQYFYAEDHEAFNPTGGEWHDTTHGWVFSDGDEINLLVGGNAYILLDLCSYSSEGTKISLGDTSVDAKVSTDGGSAAFTYTGEAGTITLNISGSPVYIHSLTILNVQDNPIAKNDAGYYVVNAGDADNLLTTLEIANATASSDERTYIFLPGGTYDLGNTTLTKISGANISLIGQSMDSTIIVNTALEESIYNTATILVTGDNCYIQDLTLQNNYDYYGNSNNGRAVCLWDQANHTICKNVRMLSYQDTYYSNNSTAEKYFETSDIHGTVDFICGDGAVFFQGCTITVEARQGGSTSGECTIVAPSTADGASYGYVFDGCTIDNKVSKYNLGRAWNYKPQCVYLNTVLKDTVNLREERWNPKGVANASIPYKFLEYASVDTLGNVITPSENTVYFYSSDSSVKDTLNTILTEKTEAEKYSLGSVFTDWSPATYATQLEMEQLSVSSDSTAISWSQVNNALAYAVFKDSVFVDIVDANTSSYKINGDGIYTVRAANSYGGFGENSTEAEITTIIKDAAANKGSIVKTVYYNLSGARVSSATKGVVIKVDTMENGKQVATKVIR
ncbi:MAG: pectinesterase family protein [Prevotella sp.]|nr:pectinesterase family protein [Prevotella sp.]